MTSLGRCAGGSAAGEPASTLFTPTVPVSPQLASLSKGRRLLRQPHRAGWTIGFLCAADGIAIGGYLLTTLSAWLWFAAVPLLVLAAIVLVAAALVLYAPCPLCGRLTSVAGRTGAQRCDACGGAFTLTPGFL